MVLMTVKGKPNKCKCGNALVSCHRLQHGESFKWLECFGCGKEEYRCECKPVRVDYHG